MIYRIEKDGELQHVGSLDGYADWTLLAELPRPLEEFETVEDGAIVLDAAAIDAALHARIDAAACAMRLRFITAGPGQELTYQRKEAEARRWLAGDIELALLPFLAAEAGATASDADFAAAAIVAAADQWAVIGSAIEGARIAAKRAVSAASTREAKLAAAGVDWEGAVGDGA